MCEACVKVLDGITLRIEFKNGGFLVASSNPAVDPTRIEGALMQVVETSMAQREARAVKARGRLN